MTDGTRDADREDRKFLEARLHDHLRQELGDDPEQLPNKKWYSIERASRNAVRSRLLEVVPGARVLDYCCGSGSHTLELAGLGADHVAGIDISSASIQIANDRASRTAYRNQVEFVVGDAEDSPFPDDHFDVALVSGVLHHLDLERAYAELARILKPNGIVIATEALRHNPIIHRYRRRTPHLRSDWEVEHILGRSQIRTGASFFEDVSYIGFYHLVSIMAVPFRRRPVFGRILAFTERIDSILLKAPGLKWMAWMVVFELGSPKSVRARQS